MTEKLIARRLIQLEIQSGMKPAEMAKVCGVSDATYYRFRNANEEKTPDYGVLKRLVDRFKIDAGWLFSEKII